MVMAGRAKASRDSSQKSRQVRSFRGRQHALCRLADHAFLLVDRVYARVCKALQARVMLYTPDAAMLTLARSVNTIFVSGDALRVCYIGSY